MIDSLITGLGDGVFLALKFFITFLVFFLGRQAGIKVGLGKTNSIDSQL